MSNKLFCIFSKCQKVNLIVDESILIISFVGLSVQIWNFKLCDMVLEIMHILTKMKFKICFSFNLQRMMQSMVTIRPHQAQAKVTVTALPTESHPTLAATKTTLHWFKTSTNTNNSSSNISNNSKTVLTSIFRSKPATASQSPSIPAGNPLCTLPRTTLQRRPANSGQPTTPKLGRSQGGLSGPRLLPEQQQSMVTVNPYDTNLIEERLMLNGCDTDDSSDSQYASVANLPSPTSHKRLPQQQHQQQPHQQSNYYTTNRLQPARQSHHLTGTRNPYVSPQLSRLTSTLRSYGYNPMETCSNSSACSSPQRTALTNLSSSSTTVSSAQLGSPHHFLGSRFHHSNDTNSELGPNTESTMLGHEPSHVYCEIPAALRTQTNAGTGNYDNVRWPTQTRGRYWQPPPPPPKYCRETDEDETATYGEDTVCDLQNVSDLSEDDQHQQHHQQQQQHRANNLKSNDCDFWVNGQKTDLPFPLSESLARETKSTKKKKTKRAGGGPGGDSQTKFMASNNCESREQQQEEKKKNSRRSNNYTFKEERH